MGTGESCPSFIWTSLSCGWRASDRTRAYQARVGWQQPAGFGRLGLLEAQRADGARARDAGRWLPRANDPVPQRVRDTKPVPLVLKMMQEVQPPHVPAITCLWPIRQMRGE